MKKNLITLSVAITTLVLTSCGSSKKSPGFSLKGKLENSSGETLILEQLSSNNPVVIDSAVINENGEFEFTNIKATPIDFFRVKTNEANFAILIADSTQEIYLTGDAKNLSKNYQVEGSEDTKQFIEINNELQKISKSLDSLQAVYQKEMASSKMDSARMEMMNTHAEGQFNGIYEKAAAVLVKKVEAFPGTIANFSAFNVINIEKNLPVYEKVLKALQEKIPASAYTAQLANSVNQYKQQFDLQNKQDQQLGDGKEMPEIKLKNPEGKEIALSSLKGKLVLIDFWASWCGPCRKENPNVVRLYNAYKNKGFEIYSVSLDEEKDKWIKAIEKDGLKWIHVSDLGGWQSSVCSQFNISSIPFTILVSKDGKIIAKGLRGQALEEKVKEILG